MARMRMTFIVACCAAALAAACIGCGGEKSAQPPTEKAFAKLRNGMSEENVRAVLGPPAAEYASTAPPPPPTKANPKPQPQLHKTMVWYRDDRQYDVHLVNNSVRLVGKRPMAEPATQPAANVGEKFDRLKLGMPLAQVRSAVGPPAAEFAGTGPGYNVDVLFWREGGRTWAVQFSDHRLIGKFPPQ
jgi:hypothetical protein